MPTLLKAAVLAAFFVFPTHAQRPTCTKRADILPDLSINWGEALVAIGLASSGGVVEALMTPTG